jgi:hypothetical protein
LQFRGASAIFSAKDSSGNRKADFMDALVNAVLGLVFLGLALVGTFLMFKLWAYPFDHKTLKSEAPPFLVMLHRSIGYAYFAIYVYLMSQMAPRIWSYQIELPARTVAHMCLGLAIGAILIVKIAVVRFFKHLEGEMVPFLGTGLFVCTALLIGLSVPFTLRASYASYGLSGNAFSQEGIDRSTGDGEKPPRGPNCSALEVRSVSRFEDGTRKATNAGSLAADRASHG